MRRSLLAVPLSLSVIVGGGALSSCGGGDPAAPSTPGGAAPRDTLVVALAADVDNLNPVVSASASDSQIMAQIYAQTIDNDFDCSLKKQPSIAKEWAWSEDGKTLTMTLDPSFTWADGTPLTAEDIAFTYELLADKRVETPRAQYIARMVEGARPRIIDPTHIEWQFTEAYDRDTQIAHVSMTPVPKHLLSKLDRAAIKGDPYSTNPLASGPFKIAKYEPDQRLVLEPNDKFTGPAAMQPELGRVIFRVIPEYSTRLMELQNGTVDMMESVNVADADQLRKSNPDIRLARRGWRGLDYIAWNLTDPRFSDKRVRQALAMSVNVDDLIAKLLTSESGESYGRPAIGTVTPELCSAYNDQVQPLGFDPVKAKALLAEAGWTDTNGDGLVDKEGKNFSFTLMTNSENKRRGDAAIRIQAYFKDVGVEMNIERVEFAAMTAHLRERQFEAALGGWSAALFVDPSDVWHTDSPDRKSEFNYTSYSNPVADALIEKGLATPEPDKAAPTWRELQSVIYDDQPYLFLWWMDEIVAIDGRFENTQINVLSNYHHLWDWSVPADKVKYPVK